MGVTCPSSRKANGVLSGEWTQGLPFGPTKALNHQASRDRDAAAEWRFISSANTADLFWFCWNYGSVLHFGAGTISSRIGMFAPGEERCAFP